MIGDGRSMTCKVFVVDNTRGVMCLDRSVKPKINRK